jgi:hypothetical protein
MTPSPDPKREFLRHTLATLAYRGGKALRGAPEGFETRRAGATTRPAGDILAHLGDLLAWALWLAKGEHAWHPEPPRLWDESVARVFDRLRALDDYLASDAPLATSPESLFQGPIADALTHVGQIATLRRLAGSPVRGENYFKAEIAVGRVGPEQTTASAEFD